MAKWKNDNGPTLWPIDMSKIGKVQYTSVPQIDVNTAISELALERSYIHPNDPHWEIIDFDTEKVIDLVCQKIGRRTPQILDGIKGDTPHTDILRAALSKCISDIHNYKNHYIDVEYDTIFGDANITLAKYDMVPTTTIKVTCIQCLVIRDSDSMIVDLVKNGIDDLRAIEDLSSRCIDANMSYEIKIETGDDTIEEKLNMQRPLWFICGGEELVFLEDGPNQNLPQQQNTNQPIYFDNARTEKDNDDLILILDGHKIRIGLVDNYGPQTVAMLFNRSKSKIHESIDIIDVYEYVTGDGYTTGAVDDEHGAWGSSAKSVTFKKSISAAIKTVNQKIGSEFGIVNMKVIQLKNKKVFINPEYLSPRSRSGRKNKNKT